MVLIFCITLFIYLHVHFHLKINDDLEFYSIDTPTKDKLEEICDLRQPIKFNFNNDFFNNLFNLENLTNNYKSFEFKIRNTQNLDNINDICLPLSLESTKKLFETDKLSSFYTENNDDFIEDSEIYKMIEKNDSFLKPYMNSLTKYDLLSGSFNTTTPLRYHLNYRNYFLVTNGEIKIKICPPKNKKNLNIIHDYYNLEFRSNDDIWNDTNNNNINKIKFMEITAKKGEIIFIPAYWWYSIKFMKNSFVTVFYYQTYMNSITISPHYFLKLLQSQNTVHKINKNEFIEENKFENKKDNVLMISSNNEKNTNNINISR